MKRNWGVCASLLWSLPLGVLTCFSAGGRGRAAHLLYAFVDGKSNWFDNDFRMTVKNAIEDIVDISPEALLDTTGKILKGYFEDSKKYLYILLELESIAKIFEEDSNLTWSKLDEFKNRPDIKTSVQTLKDKFAEDLKRSEQKTVEDIELKNELQ